MRYMVERNFVQVLGYIWMPSGVLCASEIQLSSYDVENIGDFTRENVETWLATHAGDFSEIIDFRATVGDNWIEWADGDSELKYNDCMHPEVE